MFFKDLYLSYRHDKDLIAFYQNTSKRVFIRAVKESLRLAIRPGYKTKFFKDLELSPEWNAVKEDEKIIIKITFASEKDSDIVNLIKSAKDRRASEAMKRALRFALGARYVVGNCLVGDEEINSSLTGQNMFYIQSAVPKIIYRDKSVNKKSEKHPVIKEEKEEKKEEQSSFSLPSFGLPSFGNETSESSSKDDEFTDDDILSMLDNM